MSASDESFIEEVKKAINNRVVGGIDKDSVKTLLNLLETARHSLKELKRLTRESGWARTRTEDSKNSLLEIHIKNGLDEKYARWTIGDNGE